MYIDKLEDMMKQLDAQKNGVQSLSNEQFAEEILSKLSIKNESVKNLFVKELLRRFSTTITNGTKETKIQETSSSPLIKMRNTVNQLFEADKIDVDVFRDIFYLLMCHNEKVEDIAEAFQIDETIIEQIRTGQYTRNDFPNKKFDAFYENNILNTYQKSIFFYNGVKQKTKDVDAKREEIKQLFDKGISLRVISTRFHLQLYSIATMWNFYTGRYSNSKKMAYKKFHKAVRKTTNKLTEESIREIMFYYWDNVCVKEIANAFNVHPQTIKYVVKGDTWKQVDRKVLWKEFSKQKAS